MVEEQKKRIEDQTTKMVEEIDKSYLRKMQGDMHRCAATCCDNEAHSVQKVHHCIENCSSALNAAQGYLQMELSRIQNRLQRCILDCNDKIKDKLNPNSTPSEMNKCSDEFDKCATKCVDNYCDLLLHLEKTIKSVLLSKKFEQQ